MPYDALAVGNCFLDLAEEARERLSPMKLQKLVYYAHGWHLALTDRPLLDEQIQAWSFGPVVRSLYNEFREAGAGEITTRAVRFFCPDPSRPLEIQACVCTLEDAGEPDVEFVKALLRRVWETYGNYSATQISNMTHVPDGPWAEVSRRFQGRIPKYATIPDETIKAYFKRQMEAA
jgi:uncharacterized phage-associated protein